MNVGILNPGQMGISVAASIQNSGHTVYWASSERSPASRERAATHNLSDAGTLAGMVQTCPVIVCVCPPHAAEEQATAVMAAGFSGLYVDANAIAPERAARINGTVTAGGGRFVDGGIIGGPAWKPGTTWLYLSGPDAVEAQDLFKAGPLESSVIGAAIGKASALKMCFAAYTKGSTALLCAIMAAAEELDVRDDLETQWSRNGSDFAAQTQERVRRVTAKAWRFAGEMDEIAATLDGAGVPGGFHSAAGEIYHRMAGFKDAPETPSLEAVLAALLGRDGG